MRIRLTKEGQLQELARIKENVRLHRTSECGCRTPFLCDGEMAKLVSEMRVINRWMERYG